MGQRVYQDFAHELNLNTVGDMEEHRCDQKMNLSFERLFGKLINNQENMARIVSSQQGGRMIQKAAKGIVSSIFLPIGF